MVKLEIKKKKLIESLELPVGMSVDRYRVAGKFFDSIEPQIWFIFFVQLYQIPPTLACNKPESDPP